MGFQDVMRALADPTRREILNILKKVLYQQLRSVNIFRFLRQPLVNT